LVEYSDKNRLHRVYIPTDSIKSATVDEEVLSLGIPYGIDWENKLSINISVEDIANTLREYELWTVEDVEKRPGLVMTALQESLGIGITNIFEIIRKYKTERKVK
jgi:hypothetical protein